MNTIALARPAEALELLDALRQADVVWRDRVADAEALAKHLRTCQAAVVTLHGPTKSGRTELIRRFVIPALEAHGLRVEFRKGQAVPAAEADGADILIWDDFDAALDEKWDGRDVAVRTVIGLAETGRTRIVLVVDDNQLARLFALNAAAPHVVFEISEMPRGESSRLSLTLPALTSEYGVEVTPAAVESIRRDLSEVRGDSPVDPELAGILAFELCRLNPSDEQFTVEQSQAAGGLLGLLESHLDFLLHNGLDGPDPSLGWAVLEQVAASDAGPLCRLDDIAARFDAPEEDVERVVTWLEHTRRVLRRRASGVLTFVHAEMRAAVDARLQRELLAYGWLRRSLRQGVRQFAEVDALLSESAFRRAHNHRSAVSVTAEEAELMLRCAIVYERDDDGAIAHWMRRVKEEDAQADILLGALFSSQAEVRRRAVRALKPLARPDVRLQLHLLALRDPDRDVRREALDTLSGVKDESLRAAFIEELQHEGGPHRLQAIEALQLFADPVSVAALARIVRGGAPGATDDERRAALQVLSVLETCEAADVLIDAALSNTDERQRTEAAASLTSITGEPIVRHVLAKLRQYSPDRRGPSSMSSRRVVALAGHTGLAITILFATFFVHGLVLAIRGRWRLAVVLTAVAWGAMAVDATAVLSVWPITIGIGVLLPLRTLLAPAPHGRRRETFTWALTGVLFVFASLTYFPLLHGLPNLLAGAYRRGVSLIGCQAAGIVMLVVADHLSTEFAAFSSVSGVVRAATTGLEAGSLAVLAATYLVGVGGVLLEVFVLRRRRAVSARLRTLHGTLVRNPVVAKVLVEQLADGSAEERSAAAGIVRRHGRDMHDHMLAAWERSDESIRRVLFSITARRLDADAIEMLRSMAPVLGWRARLRASVTDWAFRFSLWPRAVLIMLGLFVITAVALGLALHAKDRYQPAELADALNAEPAGAHRDAYLAMLEQLALQRDDGAAARAAADQLRDLLAGQAAATELDVRVKIIEAIGRVGPRFNPPPSSDFVDALAGQLTSTDALSPAIDALREIGTPKAVARLREFIERPRDVYQPRSSRRPDAATEIEAQKRAVAALARMEHAGFEPILALESIQANTRLHPELLRAASDALADADPLMWAEYYVSPSYAGTSAHEKAITQARSVLAEEDNVFRTFRARDIVRRAAIGQTREILADDPSNYWAARAALLQALPVDDRPEYNDEVRQLGLDIVLGLHDLLGPDNPDGYQAAYDTLRHLEQLAGQSELSGLVKSNLVEAALTSGKHEEALRRAREVLDSPSLDDSRKLVMQTFVVIALELLGHQQEADRAYAELAAGLRDLPDTQRTGWIFTGTRSYLQRSLHDRRRSDRIGRALDRLEYQPPS